MPDSSPRDIEDKNRVGVRQSQMRVRTATNFNGPNDTNGSMTTELDKTVRDYSFPAEKLVAGLNSQLQAGQSSNRTHLYPNGLSSWLSRIVPQSIHAGCCTPEAWKIATVDSVQTLWKAEAGLESDGGDDTHQDYCVSYSCGSSNKRRTD